MMAPRPHYAVFSPFSFLRYPRPRSPTTPAAAAAMEEADGPPPNGAAAALA